MVPSTHMTRHRQQRRPPHPPSAARTQRTVRIFPVVVSNSSVSPRTVPTRPNTTLSPPKNRIAPLSGHVYLRWRGHPGHCCGRFPRASAHVAATTASPAWVRPGHGSRRLTPRRVQHPAPAAAGSLLHWTHRHRLCPCAATATAQGATRHGQQGGRTRRHGKRRTAPTAGRCPPPRRRGCPARPRSCSGCRCCGRHGASTGAPVHAGAARGRCWGARLK